MNTKIVLPPALQEAAETALSELRKGNQNAECLKAIYEWLGLEGEGWEYLISDPHERYAISLSEIEANFVDYAVRENLGFEENTEIDDYDRTRWGRRYVKQALSESDRLLALPTFQIHGRDGETAFIGCVMTAEWPEGPVCCWEGLWVTREDFLEAVVKKYLIWLVPADQKVSDEAILALWNAQ